jgi:hypothetical protein
MAQQTQLDDNSRVSSKGKDNIFICPRHIMIHTRHIMILNNRAPPQ